MRVRVCSVLTRSPLSSESIVDTHRGILFRFFFPSQNQSRKKYDHIPIDSSGARGRFVRAHTQHNAARAIAQCTEKARRERPLFCPLNAFDTCIKYALLRPLSRSLVIFVHCYSVLHPSWFIQEKKKREQQQKLSKFIFICSTHKRAHALCLECVHCSRVARPHSHLHISQRISHVCVCASNS